MDLYEEARGVLDDSNLEKVLSQFGRVEVGGSYAYRTMVDRDIDFTVFLAPEAALSLDLRSDIARLMCHLPYLRNLEMVDLHRFPKGARHSIDGIWFGLTLISTTTEERWNIDIWFLSHDGKTEEDVELTRRLHHLTDEERATIVTIKQAALDAGEKEKGATSVKVYDAVLNRGVRTYEEFRQQL